MKPKRLLLIGVAVFICYAGMYLVFKVSHIEIWTHDNNRYVIFPGSLSYYAFRPLAYLDAQLTGMRFHIGPHQ